MSVNIYLDVDGVLLSKGLRPAKHANEFLLKVLHDFPDTTYWLTTHCNGDASVPVSYVGHLFKPNVQELMKNIKATSWEMAKTRGIDLTKPFLWFDDNLFYEEKLSLVDNGVLDNWIHVDLINRPDQLLEFINSFPMPVKTG